MTGPVRDLYMGNRVYLEGPHIIKRNGYYYLFCADTGTGEGHGQFIQTLIARRWTEFIFEADTKMEFEPEVFKQMAGLICMYDTGNYFYLHVTYDEDLGKCMSILTAENKAYAYPIANLPIKEGEPIYLKVEVSYDKLQFSYGIEEEEYCKIGPVFDASILSDEACNEGWFTGAMVGICCQDLTGSGKYADFDWFTYHADSDDRKERECSSTREQKSRI